MIISAAKRRITRCFAGVFCVLAVICGCSAPPAGGTQPPAAQGAEEAQPPSRKESELVFAVGSGASKAIREAALYFCERMSAATDGAVAMTVSYAADPSADLLAGKADAALLSKKSELGFSVPLEATASPFLYHSYRNFTMRANSADTLNMLERSLRESDSLIPLAAYYQGSQHLLSDSPVSSYQQFENTLFALGDDSQTRDSIARLGGDALSADTSAQRLELFINGEVTGAEILLSELVSHSDKMPAQSYLTLSHHQIIPVWLIVSADFFDGLSDRQRAEIHETVAYLTNLIDDPQVEAEKELLEGINIPGLTINTDFSNVRNRVFNTMQPVSPYANARQILADDLVRMMRRIS